MAQQYVESRRSFVVVQMHRVGEHACRHRVHLSDLAATVVRMIMETMCFPP
jgi:hypothetical protein